MSGDSPVPDFDPESTGFKYPLYVDHVSKMRNIYDQMKQCLISFPSDADSYILTMSKNINTDYILSEQINKLNKLSKYIQNDNNYKNLKTPVPSDKTTYERTHTESKESLHYLNNKIDDIYSIMMNLQNNRFMSAKKPIFHETIDHMTDPDINENQMALLLLYNELYESQNMLNQTFDNIIDVRNENDELKQKLFNLTHDYNDLNIKYNDILSKYNQLNNNSEDHNLIYCKLENKYNSLKDKFNQMNESHQKLLIQLSEFEVVESSYKSQLAELTSSFNNLNRKYMVEYNERKKLHNELIDLKGNIRIYCRVRPLIDIELRETGTTSIIEAVSETELKVHSNKKYQSFSFNRCFSTTNGQKDIYTEIDPVIISVLDGYNICIFAYGQTGSGKTYTMEGPLENPGVNRRSIARLFEISQGRSDHATYSFSISIIEIYKENIYDLLTTNRAQLDIRNDGKKFYAEKRLYLPINAIEDIDEILSAAYKLRSTSSHLLNDYSSRSHLILTIRLEIFNKLENNKTISYLNLIDLAGSERVHRTDSEGEQLQEAISINKSLSELSNVIFALSKRQKFVPYRNSVLTLLLQNSLDGSSKVIMFVNISPSSTNTSETLSSLNFAKRCAEVELKYKL